MGCRSTAESMQLTHRHAGEFTLVAGPSHGQRRFARKLEPSRAGVNDAAGRAVVPDYPPVRNRAQP